MGFLGGDFWGFGAIDFGLISRDLRSGLWGFGGCDFGVFGWRFWGEFWGFGVGILVFLGQQFSGFGAVDFGLNAGDLGLGLQGF